MTQESIEKFRSLANTYTGKIEVKDRGFNDNSFEFCGKTFWCESDSIFEDTFSTLKSEFNENR